MIPTVNTQWLVSLLIFNVLYFKGGVRIHIGNQFTREKNNNPDLVAAPGNPYTGAFRWELLREKADGHLAVCFFCCHKIKGRVYV